MNSGAVTAYAAAAFAAAPSPRPSSRGRGLLIPRNIPPWRRRTARRRMRPVLATLDRKQPSPPAASPPDALKRTAAAAAAAATDTRTRLPADSPNPPPGANPAPASSLALLNLVTVIWGTQHAVVKAAIATGASPSMLSLLRFALAAAAALPLLPRRGTVDALRAAAPAGVELGAWMFAGYAAQAVGLEYTTAARSGFLVYLNVKLVPVFARVLYGRPVGAPTWAAAAVALAGTALLTWDGSPPNWGDLWSIAAAAASAMFILRMERAAADETVGAGALNAVSLAVVAALSAAWVALGGGRSAVDGGVLGVPAEAWGAVVYLALVTTTLSNWLQAVGQRGVRAEQAAVIFAMDPVYGALFAYLLLGERFGIQGWAGVGLIASAAVVSNVLARQEGARTAGARGGGRSDGGKE
jgi:drug/metabolite transporter (DMT)-like permease